MADIRSSSSSSTLHTVANDLKATPPAPEQKEIKQVNKEVDDVHYSIFNASEKWFIVAMASMAGLFSPLAANIYFPVIPLLATVFNEPVELINVTVTVYMILQGVSPMVWGSLADSSRCGRRPVYLACLLLLSLSCVGLALTPTNAYWLLLVLRCVQAAGSASVIALGAGTIVDIATSAERGGFFGIFSLGPMVGPCIGPVAGGLLAGSLGWRSIFWFLCISSGVCFVIEFLLFPETLRTIVGDGSVHPPRLNKPIIPVLGRGKRVSPNDAVAKPEQSRGGHTPLDVLKLFRNLDLMVILVMNAIPYCVFYGLTTTLSPIFLEIYPGITETDLGLCYLANGGGCLIGSVMVGKLLDYQWRGAVRRAHERGEIEKGAKDGVHMEHTRLRSSPYCWGVFVAATIAYGWCANARVHIAALLVFQFITGYTVMGIFTMNQTLLVDLFPHSGASVTAANNLVRCLSGAALVSIVDYILDAVGTGWTFTILAAICAVAYSLVIAEWRCGRKWRRKREVRLAREEPS